MMSELKRTGLLTCVIAVIAAVPATAVDVPVTNHSFEDITGQSPFNEFTFGPPNGWNLYDPAGITDAGDGPVFFVGTLTPFEPDPTGEPGVYVFFPGGAPDGARVAIAFNFEGSGDTGEYGIDQTLTTVLETEHALHIAGRCRQHRNWSCNER